TEARFGWTARPGRVRPSPSASPSSRETKGKRDMARILFVEDEQAVLDTLTRFFERERFTVFGARSLTEAVHTIERYPADICVLDGMLNEGPEPEHNGFEVCKALRDAGFGGPVIFVTARTTEQDKLL